MAFHVERYSDSNAAQLFKLDCRFQTPRSFSEFCDFFLLHFKRFCPITDILGNLCRRCDGPLKLSSDEEQYDDAEEETI